MSAPPDDYDTPWKDAVTRYFPEFMEFYFPQAHAAINWQRPYRFLEQELAQVARDASLGRRVLDKLVQLAGADGNEQWAYIHIEVQGCYDKQFAERMFTYNYRLYDKYRRPIASMAVLADQRSGWRPDTFRYALFGSETGIRFPVVKLSDYEQHVDALLQSPNPFALVTAASLLTRQTRKDAVRRHAAKWRLARILYERDWDKQRIIDLFNVIDWMMRLPAELQVRLARQIAQLERRRSMPYINSIERLGIEKGVQKGLQEGLQKGRQEGQAMMLEQLLERRYGPLPPAIRKRVKSAGLTDLAHWANAVLDAPTLDDVFAMAIPGDSPGND